VHAAVEVQLAACTGSIIASPGYLKLSNLTLLSKIYIWFYFQRCMILIGSK